jgi:hypothetical protein
MSSLTCRSSTSASQDKVPCMPTVNCISRLGANGNKDFEHQAWSYVGAVLSEYS